MSNQCWQCGLQAEIIGFCPRCGAPEQQPVTPTQPAAPAKQPRRIGLIVGAGVAVLAMVVAVAFATVRLVPALMSAGGGQDLPGSDKAASLTVTGEPPSVGGTWASGTKEVWTVQTAGMREWSDLGQGEFNGVDFLYSRGWSLSDLVGDTAYDLATLDPNTGQVAWESVGGGGATHFCSDGEIDGMVSCVNGEPKTDTWDYDWRWDRINWETGVAEQSKRFEDMGIDGSFGYPSVEQSPEHLHFTLPMYGNYPEMVETGFAEPDYQGLLNVRMDSDGSKKLWSTHSRGCEYLAWDNADPQHGLMFPGYGVVLDESTGEEFLPEGVCAVVSADGVLSVTGADADRVPKQMKAPDGTLITIIHRETNIGSDETTIRLVGHPPPVPLRITIAPGVSDQPFTVTGLLEAFDPDTEESIWPTPVTLSIPDEGLTFSGWTSFTGQSLLFSDGERLHSIDATTGEVLWQHAMSKWAPQVGIDGTILVSSDSDGTGYHSSALDPASGVVLWTVPGDAYFAPDPESGESVLVVRGDSLSRLVPVDRATDSSTLPGDAPACPSDMTPISWTKYEGGSILLCQQEQKFVVVTPDQPKWQATELNFVPGGFEAVFGTDATIWVSLGGSAVTVEERGEQTMRPTTTAWTAARGSTDFRLPSDIKQCPAGSWPISLSTFDGGWLLVCGTAPSQPTQLVFNDGQIIDSEKVSYHSGTYCADTAAGEVCVHRSPALVTIEGDSDEVRQHSVASNYFSDFGEGGAGTGTGSYGVAAPDTNAKDQVRYITEILEKSAVGRADLNEAVGQVRACSDLPGAIRTLEGVTDNRNELLEALDSTPVDAIPGGAQLASQLRRALELSRDSDQVWVEWAESEQANGCALGNDNPLYKKVYNMNLDVALAKDAFVDNWNANITPQYGAPEFTRPQI